MNGFASVDLCTACALAPPAPAVLCDVVNGAVTSAFRNLTARGIARDRAARSAMVVLKILQPDLCPCNADRVRDWLLTRPVHPRFS